MLRTWSGLTYRQLEARAKESRAALPASTIATTLGRSTLPRESFVEAFTRACGLDDEQVRRWLDARTRIAMGSGPPVAEGSDDEKVTAIRPPEPARPRHWRGPVIVLVAIVTIGLATAFGIPALPSGGRATASSVPPAAVVPGLDIREVGSWAEIHPARTPEYCLAEGLDRTRQYSTVIAAQQPCGQAVSPRVFLDPVGEDSAVQIQWHHQETGVGCLTVITEGPGHGLLESRDDCDDDSADQLFTIEPIGPPGAAHLRIRPAGSDQCLGLRDQDTAVGTEIVQERCSGAGDQEFLVTMIPPP
ncbi:helix-turn-helix domain-containing protein [Amycolatopsis sp. lyj-112]|uniref:helix-turn-helix domain-containing protein n=1 Tax=Amycolatopsis sp. lyj-112 TaxID=2789288 RepID=UPI0039798EB7